MMTLHGKLTVKYKREPNHSGPDKFIGRWRCQPGKFQTYRAYATAHPYLQERCRHFRRG